MDGYKLWTEMLNNPGPVWGVIGTLLGAMIGMFGSWWTAGISRRHTDRTRFHDKKLVLYSDLIAAATDLNRAESVLYYSKRGEEKESQRRKRNAALDRFQTLSSTVSLIGGSEVVAATKSVSDAFFKVSEVGSTSSDIGKFENADLDFYNSIEGLQKMMRKELQPTKG
jgi:hypothetical protein